MLTLKGWRVSEKKETASYDINETMTLQVSRVEGGITIKVIEGNDKPKIMFSRFIGDGQLGLYVP